MKVIARIHSDFTSKFGIPRQSQLVDELEAYIVFEPQYRNMDALRGLEEFDYLWLIWEFSECVREDWSPMVRPPKMEVNQKMGVFATRAPYRPNPIGLSSVRIKGIENTPEYGPVIHVLGADLLDGTPIYDIKPYLPYTDAHPDARGGFSDLYKDQLLEVKIKEDHLKFFPEGKREALIGILKQDPRPAYTKFPERVFGLEFAGFDVRFQVAGNTLEVVEIVRLNNTKIKM